MDILLQYFIDDYLRHLKYEKRYSSHTIIAYNHDLLSFQLFLQENASIVDIDAIKPLHVRSWLAEMAQANQTATTIKRKKSSLQAFFTYLIIQGKAKNNPASAVATPKAPKRLPKIIEAEAIEHILDIDIDFEYETDWNVINRQLIVKLLFETGIRRAELCNIAEKDINFSRKNILIFGKGGKERVIPIHASMVASIQAYIQKKQVIFPALDTGRLFITATGKAIYDKYIYNCVKSFLNTYSTASKKSPHVLRHTFATTLLNNGADLSAIKDLLGHASLAATQVYTHTNIESLKKEFRKSHPRS